MKSKSAKVLAAAALSIAAAAPTQAHHAFSAEFDSKQPLEIKGVVTKTKWVNPHSWIYLDVADADGSVTNWGFEFGSPSSLLRLGLTKATLHVGTPVLIKGYRSRNGLSFGYTVTATTLTDGRVYQIGAAQSAPDANADGTPK